MDKRKMDGLKSNKCMMLLAVAAGLSVGAAGAASAADGELAARARGHFDRFASIHAEWMTNAIPDSAAADFLLGNAPLFECPDAEIETTYYFRWWTFRKHLFKSLGGWCVSEFMDARAISCPVGHHIREGRWLRDKAIIDDYTRYWFKKDANPIHGPGSYVNWIVRALLWREEVTGDTALADGLLDDLIANYEAWEKGWKARPWPKEGMYEMGLRDDGLFHDVDDREGTELTLSGNGARVHVNAIMYGEAKGIAKIAARCGRADVAAAFEARAAKLEKLVKERLWNEELGFFTPLGDDGRLSGVCELHGYTPWLAGLPLDEPKYAAAWRYLTDEKGFRAKVGLTFPVQSAPGFRISYEGHGCQWNGPSWPFATSVALTALGDALHAGLKLPVGKADWFDAFRRYSLQNRQKLADGRTVPWIDEVQDPYTGDWIAYRRWTSRNYAYNHSTFCDLVISGLVGLKVAADGRVTADPFIPDDWGWFRLANVPVRGRLVSVTYDRDGTHYGRGKGLRIASE